MQNNADADADARRRHWRSRRTETEDINIKLLIISDGISAICCYKPRFTFLLATPHRLPYPSPCPLLFGSRSRSRSGCCTAKDPIIKTIVRYRHLGQHVFCIRTRISSRQRDGTEKARSFRLSQVLSTGSAECMRTSCGCCLMAGGLVDWWTGVDWMDCTRRDWVQSRVFAKIVHHHRGWQVIKDAVIFYSSLLSVYNWSQLIEECPRTRWHILFVVFGSSSTLSSPAANAAVAAFSLIVLITLSLGPDPQHLHKYL